MVSIDRAARAVEVTDLATGRKYTESYDKLVLSPGAEPLRPGIEGIGDERIFTLRNVPDTDRIKAYAMQRHVRRAVVVGGGFIGLEMAENLFRSGLEVTVVEMADQVMAPLDFSMAAFVHAHLEEQGVGLCLSDGVARFEGSPASLKVHLRSGRVVETDLVILSIGVRPETGLARKCGLQTGASGGIVVNRYMQTSDEAIYALGDAVEVTHLITGKPALIPLAGPANKQGRIVADNLVSGNRSEYAGAIGTSVAQVFDLTVAAAGANAKLLQREGIPYLSSYTHPVSHAGYYPGAVPISVKILFAPSDGRVLGAQIVGFGGVDKRIEMLAQVIQRRGTVDDLAALEHAYAPPYSSAKDPVNLAGCVAGNILAGKVKTIHWRSLAAPDRRRYVIDVRTPEEYALDHIPGAVNIPVDDLRERLPEIPADRPVIVYCAVGLRGYLAYRILVQNGFTQAANLSGGFRTFAAAMRPAGKLCRPENKTGEPAAVSVIDASVTVTSSVPEKTSDAVPAPAGSPDPAPGRLAADIIEVDACGLQCPGPVMQLKKKYATLEEGERLRITASDPGFASDVVSWCKLAGASLIGVEKTAGRVRAVIEKKKPCPVAETVQAVPLKDHKTLIVFSDDLDRALASFVIANGAAATGKKVTMFFTFWGLNVIKKPDKPAVSKDFFGRMFGRMLPAHSRQLKLSKLNMGGLGTRMMRSVMRRKRIDSLETLIARAQENGIELIACTMSMEVMGVKQEELLDGVTLGGVAAYLERAGMSDVNLFV